MNIFYIYLISFFLLISCNRGNIKVTNSSNDNDINSIKIHYPIDNSISEIDSGNIIYIISTNKDNRDDLQKKIKIMKCEIPPNEGSFYLSTIKNCFLVTTPSNLIYDPQDINISNSNLVYITGLDKDTNNKLFPALTICEINKWTDEFQNCIKQNLNNIESYYNYSNSVIYNGFIYSKGARNSENFLTICPLNKFNTNLVCSTAIFDNDIANTSYIGASDNKIYFSSFDGKPVSFSSIPDYKIFSQLTKLNITKLDNYGGSRNYESGIIYFNKKYIQKNSGFILILRPEVQNILGIDRDFTIDDSNNIPIFSDNEFGHLKINKFNNTLYSVGNKYETTMSKKLTGCSLMWIDSLVKSPSDTEVTTYCKQSFYSNTVDTSIFNNTYSGEIDRTISISFYYK